MIDPDEWAKEDCACGHRRYAHTRLNGGACGRTRVRRLPPAGLTWSGEGFDAEPSVPVELWPLVEGPCGCTRFHDPEPAEPDWGVA